LEKKAEHILSNVEEHLKYFRLLGIESLRRETRSGSSDEKSENLLSFPEIVEQILTCQKCHLSRTRKHAVPGEGNLRADLMFVGEAPGRDEDIQGRPFVGRAGQLLTKIINAMSFQRDEVYITNIVKCRPPENRDPTGEEIGSCRDYLYAQIELIKPKVIVSLGRISTRFFVTSNLGMTALRGDFYDYGPVKVMPTFHPSYIIRNERNKKIKRMVWEDMQKVMALLGKK